MGIINFKETVKDEFLDEEEDNSKGKLFGQNYENIKVIFIIFHSNISRSRSRL